MPCRRAGKFPIEIIERSVLARVCSDLLTTCSRLEAQPSRGRLCATTTTPATSGAVNNEIMRRTMSQVGQRVGPNRLGLGLLGASLLVASLMLLLLVGVSNGRATWHNWDRSEELEQVTRGLSAAAGASRSLAGHNITWHKEDFPWVVYFYRNPDPQFMVPMDGYLTGFGLELNKDLLLINSAVVARATIRFNPKTNTSHVMAARRVKYEPLVDPTKNLWPTDRDARMLVIERVGNITNAWSIYRVMNVSAEGQDHWWAANDTTEYCAKGDWWTRASCGNKYRRYPDLDFVQSLQATFPFLGDIEETYLGFCYAYALSAVDWKEASRYATSFGLPAYPEHLVNADSTRSANGTRYWSRWPVKKTKCWEKNGTICELVYDASRRREDYREGKYNAPRALKCGTFQDVGAPIMCGPSIKNPLILLKYTYRGKYYEREHLRLAYVIEAPDNVDPTRPMVVKDPGCTNTFTARKILPHYRELQALIN